MRILKSTFDLIIEEEGLLPGYKGSLFRGAFGNMLKQITCINRGVECKLCPYSFSCPYTRIFEPNLVQSVQERYHNMAQKGFVFSGLFDTKKAYKNGDTLSFDLILIGENIRHLPLIIFCFEKLQQTGLGKEQLHFQLKHVWVHDLTVCSRELVYENGKLLRHEYDPYQLSFSQIIQTSPQVIHEMVFDFKTWTRIKHQGHLKGDLDFSLLYQAALRRYLGLSASFGEETYIGTPELHPSTDEIEVETLEESLIWENWSRFSRRENKTILLGGFRGKIRFRGMNLAPFYPYLKLGEYIHIGKNTSFGLGQYELFYRGSL
jgi:hypothetical protein